MESKRMEPLPLFYDTHAHLDYPDFAEDIPQVIARAQDAGIARVICVGTDLQSSAAAIRLSEQFPGVYAVVGWHPGHVTEAPADIREELRSLAAHPRVVALGETGMDFYRLPSAVHGGTREDDERYVRRQRALFEQHLEVAAETGLNCVIHQRSAWDAAWQVFAPYASRVRGVFHCFVEAPETMERVVAADSFVSFTGIVTFKNAELVRASLARVPSGRFMLETDAPFLAPMPYRGKRCEPAYVRFIAETAAQVRHTSLEELSRETCAAAHAFFPRIC